MMNKYYQFIIPTLTILGLSSCSLVESNNSISSLGKTYMQGVGNSQGGAKTSIPWDMRNGQGFWDDPGNLTGASHITIDTKAQKAYFYKGDTIVGMTPISTGKGGAETPYGTYNILEKKAIHYSGTWGVLKDSSGKVINENFSPKASAVPAGCKFEPAAMPYSLRITGGYFMHVGYVPGFPASHGCVRVPEDMAKKFWENAYVGLPVTIK